MHTSVFFGDMGQELRQCNLVIAILVMDPYPPLCAICQPVHCLPLIPKVQLSKADVPIPRRLIQQREEVPKPLLGVQTPLLPKVVHQHAGLELLTESLDVEQAFLHHPLLQIVHRPPLHFINQLVECHVEPAGGPLSRAGMGSRRAEDEEEGGGDEDVHHHRVCHFPVAGLARGGEFGASG